jgi:hypothetical protein
MAVGFLSPVPFNNGLTLITSQSFTTSSAVNVNNVFSSTYQNYKIVVTFTANTNAGNLQYRMRVSGTDNTSSVYSYWEVEPNANGATLYTSVGKSLAQGNLGYYSASGDGGIFEFIISRPFDTTPTTITGLYSTTDASNTLVTGFQGNAHRANTSYDGISLIPSSGTLTGNVRIYGIEN